MNGNVVRLFPVDTEEPLRGLVICLLLPQDQHGPGELDPRMKTHRAESPLSADLENKKKNETFVLRGL